MHINVFFISSLLLSLTSLFLIIILLRFGKEKIHKTWTFFNISIFIWALGAMLASINSTNSKLSAIQWGIGCVGVSFIGPFMLHTAYFLTKRNIKTIVFLSYFQSIIFSILFLTTDLLYTISPFKYHNFFIKSPKGLYWIWFLLWFLTITFIHLLLFQYYSKRTNREKQQLKLFIKAVLLAFIIGGLNFLSVFRIPVFEYGNFGLTLYCLIVTYAIFSHQLLDIQIVYKKGLIYSILIAILTAFYLLLIFIMEQFFRGIVGYKSIVLSLSSAFLMAILFNPLHNRIQMLVDKLFLGKTHQEISQENELLKQELERSERFKAASTLALGLAHEVRNPLTTIKTFAEFLPEKYTDKDFIEKFSKLIPTEVERINNIIHQLLTFSKPSPPSFKNTNIHRLIKDILGFLNSEFLKKKITTSEDYSDSTLIINIDPIQIKQALLNIIFNALDAMPNGGTLSIKTELTNNNHLIIHISDTGCGISKEDLKHIFDPFFTKKDEGTGLGLAITHRIIINHGGTIEVYSETGKGTIFIISLSLTTKISGIAEE